MVGLELNYCDFSLRVLTARCSVEVVIAHSIKVAKACIAVEFEAKFPPLNVLT